MIKPPELAQAETADSSRHFQEVIRYSGSPSNDPFTELVGLEPDPKRSRYGVRDIRVSELVESRTLRLRNDF
jgi:hypothetical protein